MGRFSNDEQRKNQTRGINTEEARALILREAQALFLSLGFRAVSSRMVAVACNLTQPALYHHFAGKEDLYVAVLGEELAHLRERLTAIAQESFSTPERLHHAATFLAERSHHNLALMHHDIRTELSPELAEVIGGVFFASMIAPLNRIIDDGISEGTIRSATDLGLSPIQIGLYFLRQVSFVARPRPLNQHSRTIERFVSPLTKSDQIVSLFLHGVSSTAGSV